MNVQRVDLNLLTVLHAVMAEGSVTRAARRLSMTQPAVSNALRRARALFRDDLFVKAPGGIRPTDRALAIWPELDNALTRLGELTRIPAFAPASAKMTFRAAITDSLASAVVPVLTIKFLEAAPMAKLHFQMHTNVGSIADLEQGHLDCAVGMFPNPPNTLLMRGLLRDEYVCVLRADHPNVDDVSLDAYTRLNHVLVKQAPQSRGFVDIWLELNGHKRPIVAIVNRFDDAMAIVARSDVLAAVPRRFAENSHHAGVAIRPLPFPAEPLIYKMLWHSRTDKSAAHIWFRDIFESTINSFA